MNPTTAEPDAAFTDRPVGRPQPGPLDYARTGLKALASLRLTVALFALSILLVFFGTMAQVDHGIWTVVDQYFWSWFVSVPLDLFYKFGSVFFAEYFPKGGTWHGSFPFPAGKLLGGAMLVNLLAAHAVRFRLTWKRSGVLLVHSGLVLLFVGEFVTREYAVEQRIAVEEGESANYAFSTRTYEVALVDGSDPAADKVVTVPESMLRSPPGRITHPDLPVDVEVVEYMVNAAIVPAKPGGDNKATAGLGLKAVAQKRKEASGVSNDEMDFPAAYLKLFKKGTDAEVGTYLVSLDRTLSGVSDRVRVGDTTYDLSLRFKRYYKPYAVRLHKFQFDRYLGTSKAKNFASTVSLVGEDGSSLVDTTISMNNPLRYGGETFYQSGYNERTEKGTVLQVVKNPGWLIPYISCVVVTLGLTLHFGIYLTRFLTRRAAA